MEQARLERQQQREASGASMAPRVSLKPAVKRPKVQTLSDLQDSPAEGLSTATSSSGGMGGFASASAQSRNRSATRFWSGAIKPVANQNVPGAGYSFAAIIDGGEELEMAIVGAFCVDPEWVCSHFNATTPLLLVKPRGGDDKEGPLALVDPAIKPQTYRVIPQMRAVGNPNYACMVSSVLRGVLPLRAQR